MNNKTPSESVTAKFTYDFDLKYIGEEVSVLYKDSTNSGTRYQPDDNDTIYGVVVTGNTSVVNATVDDIDGDYNTAGKVSISDTMVTRSSLFWMTRTRSFPSMSPRRICTK